MKILISNASDSPLYQQIKEQIKDAILKEEFVEGDALPSITSKVGKGTFVSAGNLELLLDSRRRLVEQKMLAMIQTAKSLKISKEELNAMMDILYEED